ncbi:hypothetical protein EU527_10460 [Candidatus Thorarchaeota archaeon]|nr:MAG: hypothetical protein EU527_10460 [Candidatus Thorarchaeota archaeon]
MRRTGWTDSILIIALGLAVLMLSLLLASTGYLTIMLSILSVITPMTALLLGVFGLRIYAGKSEAREDRLHTLNLWFSIGLIMFSLAEITGTLVRFTQNSQQMVLTIILIHIPGILLWGFGIIQYLSSLNMVFKFSDNGKLWIVLVVISGIASISLIVVMAVQSSESYLVEKIILSPIMVGLILFTIITGGLVWIFRGGLLSRPLLFTLSAFSLLAIRIIFWVLTEFQLGTLFDSLISIEVYVLCGAGLMLSKDFEILRG